MLRLLLVEENDLIANRFATIAGEICLVTRFRDAREAQTWLHGSPEVHLVITDKKSATPISALVRGNFSSRPIPVLTVCNFMDNRSVKSALDNGVTDMLTVSDDNQSLRAKMNYYLDLNSSLTALSGNPPVSNTFGFSLPWWKRAIDIAVSLTAVIILSPFLLIIALLIKLDSKGPVLYKSKRAGAQFKVFDMYKFRTMRVEADTMLHSLSSNNIYSKEKSDLPEEEIADPSEFLCSICRQLGTTCQQLLFDQDRPICEKLYLRENEEAAKFMKFRNDPRITRLGTFLRNSSIDELPQLLNILLGDMSLVGNRPLPIYEAEKLTTDEFAQRFAGPAGLTGLWQVKKRAKGQGTMSDRERTLLDIEYAQTFSFKTDMYIIWQTLFSLWQQENV